MRLVIILLILLIIAWPAY
ncbi:type I toxin-antitoxin system Ibs family toxin [Kluyvera ascorbata]